jgi:hypothetical protein
MHMTKGKMQQIMVLSLKLRACQQAGKRAIHLSLSMVKAMVSQTTGEHIGSGEKRASTSARQAIAM